MQREQSEPRQDRPRITFFWSSNACNAQLLEKLLQGIEEEGVPCECLENKEDLLSAAELSARAARVSFLEVGLGLDYGGSVALHHRRLPPDQPLFILQPPHADSALRRMGSHAARLVKGLPFRLAPPSSSSCENFYHS